MNEKTERMRGKAEQIVGGVKRGVGDAVDDPDLEAEGAAEQTRGKVRETGAKVVGAVKGAADEVAGAVKGAFGDAADDPALEAEGNAQRLKGQVQRKANR